MSYGILYQIYTSVISTLSANKLHFSTMRKRGLVLIKKVTSPFTNTIV